MSLSLALTINTGGPDPATVWDGWNYTHNVNPMWWAALPSGESLGGFLEGKTVSETLPDLRAAHAVMAEDPGRFRAMNPENGWGDYDTALEALRAVIEAADAHPLCSWWVSR